MIAPDVFPPLEITARTRSQPPLYRIPLMLRRVVAPNWPQAALPAPAETLVADPRGGLTPSQMMESRLQTLLGGLRADRMRMDEVRPRDPQRGQAGPAEITARGDEPGDREIVDRDHRPA
jgi:hypothetical protein